MSIGSNQYICFWKDAAGGEAQSGFRCADDTVAIAFANRMAATSSAQLAHFYRLVEIGPVISHPAASGSNVQAKTFFHYKAGPKKAMKLHVPSFNLALLEVDQEKTNIDRIGGVGVMQTPAGNLADRFIKGILSVWR